MIVSVNGGDARPGDELRYTVSVVNTGPVAALNVVVSDLVPAALEMMDGPTIRAVEASIYAAGYPVDAAAVLLALNTLAELFPSREVVGIHAVDLVWGLGTLHCLTQQEPRPRVG